jgi:hypothetical protein
MLTFYGMQDSLCVCLDISQLMEEFGWMDLNMELKKGGYLLMHLKKVKGHFSFT